MGQRNEQSVRELLQEARLKKDRLKDKQVKCSTPKGRLKVSKKMARCQQVIDFCRWQLGIDNEKPL